MQILMKAFLIGLMLNVLASCSSIQTKDLSLLSLDGWQSVGSAHWASLSSGEVVASEGDGFLVSIENFSEYELQFEFNVGADTNSGVMIHCQNPFEISPLTCYEINIWDEHPQQEYRTGAIVLRVPPLVKIDTLGQWNTYRVVATAQGIEVHLNGVLVSRLLNPEHSAGYIALQFSNGGFAKFRNFRIQSIDAET